MKGKEYVGKNIEDFKGNDNIMDTLESLELNFCDKCGVIDVSEDLNWTDDSAFCEDCFKQRGR